ncbi:MAG: thiol peroxidase [Planctomycetes bacterium]|nr:thiol peroxidase [Planctomycetota bacterium]
MPQERAGATTLKGGPLTLVGPELKAGDSAPDFKVSKGLTEAVSLSNFKGKVKLLVAVPSLDTPVCDQETRRFNEEAAKLGDKVKTILVSVDLPPAQGRFCTTAGIKNLEVLSDHKEASFGANYGCLIKELRLLSRAIFVVGTDDKIKYVQYVKEVADHPDYEKALNAAKTAAA